MFWVSLKESFDLPDYSPIEFSAAASAGRRPTNIKNWSNSTSYSGPVKIPNKNCLEGAQTLDHRNDHFLLKNSRGPLPTWYEWAFTHINQHFSFQLGNFPKLKTNIRFKVYYFKITIRHVLSQTLPLKYYTGTRFYTLQFGELRVYCIRRRAGFM